MNDTHELRGRGRLSLPQKILAIALVALALGLATQAWPPSAWADTPATQRVTLFDMPVTGGANVLTSSLTLSQPTRYPSSAFRFTVLVKPGATDSEFKPVVTAGGVSFAGQCNTSTALVAGSWYTFTIGPSNATTTATSQSLTWNVQFGTSTTIAYLDIQEVPIP